MYKIYNNQKIGDQFKERYEITPLILVFIINFTSGYFTVVLLS